MKPPGDQRRDVYGRLGVTQGPRKPGKVLQSRSDLTHVYFWGNNSKRASLQGQRCKILKVGKMHSALVEFENGACEIVSIRALRKIREDT